MSETQEKITVSSLYFVRTLLRQVAAKGGNLDKIMEKVGIYQSGLELNLERVPTPKLVDLSNLLLEFLHDENLGFSKYPCKPGTFYWMALLAIHEPTLEQAIQLGIRFYSHWVEDYELDLHVSGDMAYFKIRLKYPELDANNALMELLLTSWHHFSSWLIDQNIPIIEAYLAYPKPSHWKEYQFILPSVHYNFDQSENGFCFSASFLKREVVQDKNGFDTLMNRNPLDVFVMHKGDDSCTKKVRIMLEKGLGENHLPQIECIAKGLNMSPATLRRKLKSEGMSYRGIKDLVRRDTAFYYLSNRSDSVNEIAEFLGFSDPSVFARAFKGWTGFTPQELRRRNKLRR